MIFWIKKIAGLRNKIAKTKKKLSNFGGYTFLLKSGKHFSTIFS